MEQVVTSAHLLSKSLQQVESIATYDGRQDLVKEMRSLVSHLEKLDAAKAKSQTNGIHDEPPSSNLELTAPDLNGLHRCLFEWSDSYDNKDWERLARNISPTLRVDYRGIGKENWPEMPAAEFLEMVKHPGFLGNPRIHSQHLMGASFFKLTAPDEAEGRHQIRAAHQVYTDDTHSDVKLRGHVHATNTHWYKKIDGVWKFAGLKPVIVWNEGDFEKVWD